METKEIKEFLKTDITFGLILKGDFEEIKELKQTIGDYVNKRSIDIIYQKLSLEPLFISHIRTFKDGADMNEVK
jgi:hypothetical protein